MANQLRYIPNVSTLRLEESKCNGCSTCLLVCPQNVYVIEDGKARIADLDACMECGACSSNCSEGALTVRTGVGCAYGVIMGFVRGTDPTCDCGTEGCC